MMTLSRAQRDVLYRLALVDVSGVVDVRAALARGDLDELLEARSRFEDACSLLDALGWAATDERESYPVSAVRLVPFLRRHRVWADIALREVAAHPAAVADPGCVDEELDVVLVCDEVLEQLRAGAAPAAPAAAA